ncbi:MAG: DUF4878 domain-containing protein [Butyrivibrio sp.]|nr:DUF4878 domain-containing protein [Butyrivibrio sp.]
MECLMVLCISACSSSNSPSDVVKEYFEACKKGNFDKAVSLIDIQDEEADRQKRRLQKEMHPDREEYHIIRNGKVEILNETINGDYAEVEYSLKYNGKEEIHEVVKLVKVFDRWLIDD